jgi:hypothetical protein
LIFYFQEAFHHELFSLFFMQMPLSFLVLDLLIFDIHHPLFLIPNDELVERQPLKRSINKSYLIFISLHYNLSRVSRLEPVGAKNFRTWILTRLIKILWTWTRSRQALVPTTGGTPPPMVFGNFVFFGRCLRRILKKFPKKIVGPLRNFRKFWFFGR